MTEKVYAVYELVRYFNSDMYRVNLIHLHLDNVLFYGKKEHFYSVPLPNGHDRGLYFIALVVR